MESCVYIIRANGLYKIGVSSNLKRRLQNIKTYSPDVELIHTIESEHPYELEKHLHKIYHQKHYKGEWFKLNDQDIASIKDDDSLMHGQWSIFWICPKCNFLTEKPGMCDSCRDDGIQFILVEKMIVIN